MTDPLRSKKTRKGLSFSSTVSLASTETLESRPRSQVMQRVAVIGGGVSGLSAAWHLHQLSEDPDTNHWFDVHVFEAKDRLGGHAWTVPIELEKEKKTIDADIGFMVFNEHNYPNLLAWFDELGIAYQDSDMSLSVSLIQHAVSDREEKLDRLEWSSDGQFHMNWLRNWNRSILSPLLQDILRFHREAPRILLFTEDDPRKHVTTGEYLRTHGYTNQFATYYLLPLMAALWSASLANVLHFPAVQLVAFLKNHQMLQLIHRPTWKTVVDRSQQYVNAVSEALGPQRIHVNTPIAAVSKTKTKTQFDLTGPRLKHVNLPFDHVVFACHAPTVGDILSKGGYQQLDPSLQSRLPSPPPLLELLKGICYEDNVVYVHSDPRLMPANRSCWASWNCMGREDLLQSAMQHGKGAGKGRVMEGSESGFGNTQQSYMNGTGSATNDRMKAVYVTYNLNRIQSLDTDQPILVSLNPHVKPKPELTHHTVNMAHPQFCRTALQSRKSLLEHYQGLDNIWYAGAWTGYGFHEDGCRSGFDVSTKLSSSPVPWVDETYGEHFDELRKKRLLLDPPDLAKTEKTTSWFSFGAWYRYITYNLPVQLCKSFVIGFLRRSIHHGTMRLLFNDGTSMSFGDGTPCGNGISDDHPVTLRIFDDMFFVKVCLEYDLGLARAYMAGYFVVQPLSDHEDYHPVLRPEGSPEESSQVLGDPVGLTRLFLLVIANRDASKGMVPQRSIRRYGNAFTNASGLVLAKIGSLLNYIRFRLFMNNSERGGSLSNIHAHYDISNDLFTCFLDKTTMMYSSAIYDTVPNKKGSYLEFHGTLDEAQIRKLDTLLEKAQVQPGQTLLDIGFGWGGLAIHAARKYGCRVTGLSLSVEQHGLALERVKKAGLETLIDFHIMDYRTFCRKRENRCRFDRVLSCEMIEAVGHNHLGEFFWAVEQVLKPNGVFVMEAITTPESRYETYMRSTDFINTVIFPGSCCPSLHALVDASYRHSTFTLEHIDNIGLHYAHTLAEWRRRFNSQFDLVRSILGFDDVFLRCWNYYMSYCEAGFVSQTENCLILVWSRQGCRSLVPLGDSKHVCIGSTDVQLPAATWVEDDREHVEDHHGWKIVKTGKGDS